MSFEERLADLVHGRDIAPALDRPVCDLHHEATSVVDTSTPVQYELVRVHDLFPQFEAVPHHEWVPDLLVLVVYSQGPHMAGYFST